MGILTEMCNCPAQQMIASNQKSNVENFINNDDINNIQNINPETRNNLAEKNGKKGVNTNEANNDAETYNISLKGGKPTSKHKKKGKDKISRKGTDNKDRKKRKSDKKSIDQSINMMANGLIEENIGEMNISDSLVTDITLRDKLKTISKEKVSKIRDSNKINIVIIGQKEVGKSSFCIRFVENRFEDYYIPSIGIEKFAKMTAYNSRNYKVNFSIICGSDKLRNWINLIEVADFFFFFTT